jgi:hypothetical protein
MKAMQQPEKAQPLLAFVEFQAVYGSPNFELSTRVSAIMSAVFEAFRPWNITLANISAKQNPANAGEIAILFSLQNAKLTFSVGIGASTLLVTNPDWSQEQLISQITTAGLQAVQNSSGVNFRRYLISLLMHVKPERRSLSEISADFLNLKSPKISGPTIKARGFSVYADDFSWVVDSSAIHEGALFLKIVRSFEPNVSFPEMAAALRADQSELLGTLQLTVE